jgi:hypothetical protein
VTEVVLCICIYLYCRDAIETVGWLKCGTWYCLRMHYMQCKLGWNRSVMKGTLLLRPIQFSSVYPVALRWESQKCNMALPAHTLQAVLVSLQSLSNEGHFTREDERLFRPFIPSKGSGVVEICHMALPAHALRTVQAKFKSVCNEGHFTLQAETVSRPYFPPHCSGVTELCHMALPAHALSTVKVRFKSGSNGGHFNLEAQRVSHAYVPSQCSGMTETCHMAFPAHALRAAQDKLKSVSNEGHFTQEAETLYRPVSPGIAVRWLKHAAWDFLQMRYKQ